MNGCRVGEKSCLTCLLPKQKNIQANDVGDVARVLVGYGEWFFPGCCGDVRVDCRAAQSIFGCCHEFELYGMYMASESKQNISAHAWYSLNS